MRFGCNEGSPPSSVDKVLREIVHTNTDLMYQPNSASGVITGDGTDRVLSTLYGGNYLWLLPGESRTVTRGSCRPWRCRARGTTETR